MKEKAAGKGEQKEEKRYTRGRRSWSRRRKKGASGDLETAIQAFNKGLASYKFWEVSADQIKGILFSISLDIILKIKGGDVTEDLE